MTDHLSDSDKEKLLDAWFEYRDEADKFLFAGSAAGVGFCLHQVFGENTALCEGLLLLASATLFGVVCALVVLIFKRNSTHMASLLTDPSAATRNKSLEAMDWSAIVIFALAVAVLIFSSIIHLFS